MRTQARRSREPGELGYPLDSFVSRLEQPLGAEHALVQQPFQDGGPGALADRTYEVSLTEPGFCGESRNARRLIELVERPRQSGSNRVLAMGRRQWCVDVLRLSAIAVRWQNHPPSQGVGDRGAMIVADDV